jgi:hypothetical protein
MASTIESGDLELNAWGDEVKVTFGWKDISYSVPTNTGTKHILQNVSGFLKSGIISSVAYPCSHCTSRVSGFLRGPT